MHVRPECAALIFLEQRVVQETEDGLQEDENEYYDTDDGVVMIEHLHLRGDVHTETKRSNIDQVCENLEHSMEPDNARERCKTDSDGACWEEDDKCEGCENAMRDEHGPSLRRAATTRADRGKAIGARTDIVAIREVLSLCKSGRAIFIVVMVPWTASWPCGRPSCGPRRAVSCSAVVVIVTVVACLSRTRCGGSS